MNELEQAREIINDCDREMAALFEKRMLAVKNVAAYKAEHGMAVFDSAREAEVIARNAALVGDETLLPYYTTFQNAVMAASRTMQHHLLDDLYVSVEQGYEIVLERGCLARAGKHLNLDRRVLVVTDSGVPSQYAATLARQCKDPIVATLPQGEASKNFANFEKLCGIMLSHGFDRHDCVVAVGGGVVGDLAGFVASSYMRGVDFYNIPTTLLSQVDSSIGGKTAVDINGIKNAVGAFKQPKKVLIDPEVLSTLTRRQYAAGMAEVIKMALTHRSDLFCLLEEKGLNADPETVIAAALRIKRDVVEADEKEMGLRRVLNFGHTVGHAIETRAAGDLLHGECVALGMLPMCAASLRQRLINLYTQIGLPTVIPFTAEQLCGVIVHDKKMVAGTVNYVFVKEAGSFELCSATTEEYLALLREELGQ